jgi:hypothetical protein
MPNGIEKTIAKTAGVAKAAKARIQGLSGVFNTLAEQHTEASVLLQRTRAATGAKQQNLWKEVKAELLSHERAELQEIYRVLGEYPRLRDVVASHGMDATTLEAAIEQVDACAFDTEDWAYALDALLYLVQQHAEQEEQVFFPVAIDVIGKQKAKALEQPFEAARQAHLVQAAG